MPKTTWLAALIPVLVSTSYQYWLSWSGYGTTIDAYRKFWHLETVPPWTGILIFLQRLPCRHLIYSDWIDLALTLLIMGAAVAGLRRLSSTFSLYVWLNIAMLWMRWTPHHLLLSYSRYFLALFPFVLLPAMIPERRLSLAIVMFSFIVQIVLVTIFLWGSWVA